MAALSENVGILFRIKADSSDAQADIKKFKGELNSMKDGGTVLEKLAASSGLSAAQFSKLQAGAAAAAAGVVAITAIAVTAATTLFNLAKSASDYGSAIWDAQQKTGLSAATLSTLKLAADSSGSSFEQVSGAVSKFAALVGQANLGNEKAIATLDQYKIKSRDLNGALEEAIALLAKESDETRQAAIAKDLFKDRTGSVIPVIKALDGSLAAATEKAKKLGVTLSEDDVKAADEFGDAFDVVSTQVKVGAARFALQYAPQITGALQSITNSLAANQQKWGEWGSYVTDIITGTGATLRGLGSIADGVLNHLTGQLLTQGQRWGVWGELARFAIGTVTGRLGLLVEMLASVGKWLGQQDGMAAGVNKLRSDNTIDFSPGGSPSLVDGASKFTLRTPKLGGTGGGKGGGGGGGGGRSTADNAEREAEERRRKAVQMATDEMQETLGVYKAGYANRLALLDYNLAQKLTSELNYIRDVGRIHLEALQDEKRLNKELLKNENLNAEEKKDIANKIKILEIEIRTEKTKTATKVIEQIGKEDDAAEDAHQKELKRLQAISDKKQRNFLAWQLERQERLRALKEEADARTLAGIAADGGGGFLGAIADEFDSKGNLISEGLGVIGSAFQQLKEIGMGALSALAQGIGSMIQNWVLMGDTGGQTFRKLAAQIIASVAMQAATMAIMCLAYAALATTAVGAAILGGTPAQFLIAAAIFGSIAVGAALVGRAVAGDSFKQQTANATGSSSLGGGSGSNGSNDPTRYTTEFGGYGTGQNPLQALIKRQNELMDRSMTVNGQLEETVHQFTRKVTSMPASEIVAIGASDASREIRHAYESELQGSVAATDRLMRGTGLAR